MTAPVGANPRPPADLVVGALVDKVSFMTILCHFGCVIPNIRVNLDASFEHPCHIGPFSCHIGHFLSFWTMSQKTMFSTSGAR